MSVYRDFVPRALSQSTFFHMAEYEHFDAAAEAAVAWIKESGVKVLSIETVVLPLPNMKAIPNESGVVVSMPNIHAQFVRVWFLPE